MPGAAARLSALLAGLALLVTVFAHPGEVSAREPRKASATAADSRRSAFAAVKSWGIHLRYMDKRQLAASPFDLIVVDHAPYRHLTFEFPYERDDIALMQKKPDGTRRLVLAYLSIGEVEDYRFYWRRDWEKPGARPSWIGPENPKWPGNYPARFWEPEWQKLLFGAPAAYLDRLIASGFDGVYLDRADVYEELTGERPRSADDMARLLEALSRYAHARNPGFLVVLQNAEELLARASVRAAIDGFAKEDLIFGAEQPEQANTPAMVAHSIGLLRRAQRDRLPVLVLEYLSDAAKTAEARRRITAEGFLPHFAERSLNTLTLVAPDEPGYGGGAAPPVVANPAGAPAHVAPSKPADVPPGRRLRQGSTAP